MFRDHRNRHFLNNAGLSLPEVMIAAGFLAITVTAVMTLTSSSERSVNSATIQGSSACLAEAHRILSNVRERGIVRSFVDIRAAAGTGAPYFGMTPGAPLTPIPSVVGTGLPGQAEVGLSDADRWGGVSIYSGVNTFDNNGSIYPHRLIMGTMSMLDALVNRDQAICDNARGLGPVLADFIPARNAAQDMVAGIQNAQGFLKVQPFDIRNGATLGCSPPARPRHTRPQNRNNNLEVSLQAGTLRPRGLSASQYPENGTGVFSLSRNTDMDEANKGWLVTASVTYTDRAGRNRECRAQERFQYQPLPVSPLTLAVVSPTGDTNNLNASINTTNLGNPPAYNDDYGGGSRPLYHSCTSGDTAADRTVRARITGIRRGSIMMCRNLSKERSRTHPNLNVLVQGAFVQTRLTGAPGNEVLFQPDFPERQTFHSSELLKMNYFRSADLAHNGEIGDMLVMGLHYPGGIIHCRPGHNCAGLPVFDIGLLHKINYTANTHLTDAAAFNDHTDGNYFYFREQEGLFANTSNTDYAWRPCERLTNVCYRSLDPSSGYTSSSPDSPKDQLDLIWTDLPRGCDLHIQVAEVDASYNVQATEIREYIQERVPGNWLCRAGEYGTGEEAGVPLSFQGPYHSGDINWFFRCGAQPAGYENCATASGPYVPCCMPYPTYVPVYKSHYPPNLPPNP